MKPHIEEAWRALRLSDRDITVFDILVEEPEAHLSIVLFHAQQAVEKSLKAVLFSRQIEFRRTHDLTELAQLLRQEGVETPVVDGLLERMNPFAVTFRYDDARRRDRAGGESSEMGGGPGEHSDAKRARK